MTLKVNNIYQSKPLRSRKHVVQNPVHGKQGYCLSCEFLTSWATADLDFQCWISCFNLCHKDAWAQMPGQVLLRPSLPARGPVSIDWDGAPPASTLAHRLAVMHSRSSRARWPEGDYPGSTDTAEFPTCCPTPGQWCDGPSSVSWSNEPFG